MTARIQRSVLIAALAAVIVYAVRAGGDERAGSTASSRRQAEPGQLSGARKSHGRDLRLETSPGDERSVSLLIRRSDDERPLAQVRVRELSDPLAASAGDALGQSDADGRFSYRGRARALLLEAKGYASRCVLLEADEQRVYLRRHASIRGRCLDRDGMPLPGVRVVASLRGQLVSSPEAPPLGLKGEWGCGVSDANGAFRIDGLEAGESYHLEAAHDELLMLRPPRRVQASEDGARCLLVLAPSFLAAVAARGPNGQEPTLENCSFGLEGGLGAFVRLGGSGVARHAVGRDGSTQRYREKLQAALPEGTRLLCVWRFLASPERAFGNEARRALIRFQGVDPEILHSDSLPIVRADRFAAKDVAVVDLSSRVEDRPTLRLKFLHQGRSVAEHPPFQLVRLTEPGGTWSRPRGEGDATLHLPSGQYELRPDWESFWPASLPFSFETQRFTLPEGGDAVVEQSIEVSQPLALYDIDLRDSVGLPFRNFSATRWHGKLRQSFVWSEEQGRPVIPAPEAQAPHFGFQIRSGGESFTIQDEPTEKGKLHAIRLRAPQRR